MPKAVPKIQSICEQCGATFERTPAFHRSAITKGGKVRFCGTKCFGKAKSNGLIKVTHTAAKIMFVCEVCNKSFGRWPSAIKWAEKRGRPIRFCSQKCHGEARTARMVLMPKSTTESNRKRSDGNRAAWGLPPHTEEVMNLPKKQRASLARGIGFNASQIRDWLKDTCERCGGRENLELDHIICMAAGGKSVRENAQTLCRPCNRWKIKHVDKPLVRQQSQLGGKQ